MQNFKIEVSKNNKKYNIVLKAENEVAARDRVHREWYSILSIKEITDKKEIGDTFIFEWYVNWELKHWKIVWNDIFKAYVKLTRDLWYELDYIFPENYKWESSERKQQIIEELREEYDLFYNKKKTRATEKKQTNIENDTQELRNFYLNRELTETNKLITKVLIKLDEIFAWTKLKNLEAKKKEILRQVYNEIIKLQKSTNISKLKEIWELALIKIWELELEELEKTKNKEDRDLLKETNKLLKDFWSKSQFIEKDKDIKYQIQLVIDNFKQLFKRDKKQENKKVSEEERTSYLYVKNLLYLKKYKAKLTENNKFILKNIFKLLTDKELREETFLTRNVIKQNIILLNARQEGVKVSYTLVKKWAWKLFDAILWFFKSLEKALFLVIFIYTLIILSYWTLYVFIKLPEFTFNWLFAFIIIILLYLCIYLSRNLFILILNFVILVFIIIFWVINF